MEQELIWHIGSQSQLGIRGNKVGWWTNGRGGENQWGEYRLLKQ
jgi:hypothetical protein